MYNKEVYLPLITPLDAQGAVCAKSVKNLMSFAHNYVDGYVPCLTSGEGWCLSRQQWRDMISYCVDNAAGRPVIAGIERPSTAEVIDYAREAEALGVNGIICTAPFTPGLSQQAIYDHFARVHDAITVDLHIYFESTLCNNRWEIPTLLSLCLLPRVKGIKESSGEDKVAPNLRNIRRMGVKIFQGWEDKILHYDTDGAMVSYCNLNPKLCRNVTCERSYAANTLLVDQCREEGIFEPDWYRHMKLHLFERGIISTPLTVDGARMNNHDHAKTTVPA